MESVPVSDVVDDRHLPSPVASLLPLATGGTTGHGCHILDRVIGVRLDVTAHDLSEGGPA
jgi:hypothetical protein